MTIQRKLFLLGASGHAKMVIECALSMKQFEIVACLDSEQDSGQLLGVPCLAETNELLEKFANTNVCGFVAIGDNRLRKKLSERLVQFGIEQPAIVSASAILSPSAKLGGGTVMMPGSIVGAAAIVGSGSILNTGCSLDHDCTLGDFAHIAPGCNIAGNVKIGDGAFLGIGSVVIPELIVGEWSTIAAGAVVICNVPSHEVWVGCPARAKSSQHMESKASYRCEG